MKTTVGKMTVFVSDLANDVDNGWTVEIARTRMFDFDAIRAALAANGITCREPLKAVEVNENREMIGDITWE